METIVLVVLFCSFTLEVAYYLRFISIGVVGGLLILLNAPCLIYVFVALTVGYTTQCKFSRSSSRSFFVFCFFWKGKESLLPFFLRLVQAAQSLMTMGADWRRSSQAARSIAVSTAVSLEITTEEADADTPCETPQDIPERPASSISVPSSSACALPSSASSLTLPPSSSSRPSSAEDVPVQPATESTRESLSSDTPTQAWEKFCLSTLYIIHLLLLLGKFDTLKKKAQNAFFRVDFCLLTWLCLCNLCIFVRREKKQKRKYAILEKCLWWVYFFFLFPASGSIPRHRNELRIEK